MKREVMLPNEPEPTRFFYPEDQPDPTLITLMTLCWTPWSRCPKAETPNPWPRRRDPQIWDSKTETPMPGPWNVLNAIWLNSTRIFLSWGSNRVNMTQFWTPRSWKSETDYPKPRPQIWEWDSKAGTLEIIYMSFDPTLETCDFFFK